MTSLTHCFDDGVRCSFDVILFVHRDFSTSQVCLGAAELRKDGLWAHGFAADLLPQVLSLVLLSQPSLWLPAAFLLVLLWLFTPAHRLKKTLVPLYMHSDDSNTHFLSQATFAKPCIVGNHSYCFSDLILHRFHYL